MLVPGRKEQLEEPGSTTEHVSEAEIILAEEPASSESLTLSGTMSRDVVRVVVVLVMLTLFAVGTDILTVSLSGGTLLLLLDNSDGSQQSDVRSSDEEGLA